MKIGSRTGNVDVEHIVGGNKDHRFRKMLRSCQHFLVESELERARHKVFNYSMENLNAKILVEKLDHFFNNLECAAKVNLAFRFFLRNFEDGGFRFFYAHGNNATLDPSKRVCTRDELAELQDFLNKIDVKESLAEKE